jgi:hypothetical protein
MKNVNALPEDALATVRAEGIHRSVVDAAAIALGRITVSPPADETLRAQMPHIILGTS